MRERRVYKMNEEREIRRVYEKINRNINDLLISLRELEELTIDDKNIDYINKAKEKIEQAKCYLFGFNILHILPCKICNNKPIVEKLIKKDNVIYSLFCSYCNKRFNGKENEELETMIGRWNDEQKR